ncbi:MAG TPA: site-specific integrase, partial [Prolixibacteraceae bacterium]|nr:site-specific integrase [Prolixibacteraceae bacterium]
MKKRDTFGLIFYIKKTIVNKSSESPIYLRITYNGKNSSLSLHRSILSSSWNSDYGAAIGNNKYSKELNQYLNSVRTKVHLCFQNLREKCESFTVNEIKNSYLGINERKGKKLLEYFFAHNKKMELLMNIDYAPGTVKRYQCTYNHVRNFIQWKYCCNDVYLSDVNPEFINEFELYLKTVCKCIHNTSLKNIKNMGKIIRLAIANGHLDKDPFVNFKSTYKSVQRDFLTEQELNRIIQKNFPINRLNEIRDCFIFSCFTGLAHADLIRLNNDNLVIGNDGGKWIKIKRKKTNVLSSIPVLSVTQQIIDKYSKDQYCIDNNVLLPVRSNQKMNAYLKEIADICEIKKNITSHIARHTFATTVTLNNNVPIETVSKMLGHSSLDMT